jgi:hypothetical protein
MKDIEIEELIKEFPLFDEVIRLVENARIILVLTGRENMSDKDFYRKNLESITRIVGSKGDELSPNVIQKMMITSFYCYVRIMLAKQAEADSIIEKIKP